MVSGFRGHFKTGEYSYGCYSWSTESSLLLEHPLNFCCDWLCLCCSLGLPRSGSAMAELVHTRVPRPLRINTPCPALDCSRAGKKEAFAVFDSSYQASICCFDLPASPKAHHRTTESWNSLAWKRP